MVKKCVASREALPLPQQHAQGQRRAAREYEGGGRRRVRWAKEAGR